MKNILVEIQYYTIEDGFERVRVTSYVVNGGDKKSVESAAWHLFYNDVDMVEFDRNPLRSPQILRVYDCY